LAQIASAEHLFAICLGHELLGVTLAFLKGSRIQLSPKPEQNPAYSLYRLSVRVRDGV